MAHGAGAGAGAGAADAADAALRATVARWEVEQAALAAQLSCPASAADEPEWARNAVRGLRLVGGFDVSFVKGSDEACASLAVVRLPDLEVVYADMMHVVMDEPYVAGFLAFREAKHLVALFRRLEAAVKEGRAEMPQVFMVDGNGLLHHKGFGLACHVGVLLGVPMLGVAKTLLHVDGLTKDGVRAQLDRAAELDLARSGAAGFVATELTGGSGRVWGAAVRSTKDSTKPLFVSQGHGLSLESALDVVRRCSRFRVPEPTRQADLRSREWLREREARQGAARQGGAG